MDQTAIIIAVVAPFFVLGVVLFRWWLLGEESDTGFLEDGTRELNADDNVNITRLDLNKPPKR